MLLPPVSYLTGAFNPVKVVVADVNGDGKPDMIVANQCSGSDFCAGTGTVGVLLGTGDGTFQTPVTYNSGGSFLNSVAVGDVNGDGALDLVVTNGCANVGGGFCSAEGAVGVLLGSGNGTFQPAVIRPSGGFDQYNSDVAVADMNGDGSPDLVVMNGCSAPCNPNLPPQASVSILLSMSGGNFRPAVSYTSGGYFANSLAVADLNGDGKADVAVAHACAATTQIGNCPEQAPIGVLLGNGDGTLQPPIMYRSGGEIGRSVAVADLNGDGRPDLVTGNCGPTGCGSFVPARGVVGVLLGNGDGSFQPAVAYGAGSYFAIAVADVDRDARLDVVTASFSCPPAFGGGCVDVLLGNGDGSLGASAFYDRGIGPLSTAAADVNGDGAPDVVVTREFGNGAGIPQGMADVLLSESQPPDVTPPLIGLLVTPAILWPPNGRLVAVTVSGTTSDAGSGVDRSSATYRVEDEYGQVQPSGTMTLDAGGNYSFTVMLQASRSGSDRAGRHYRVIVGVKDNAGNNASDTGVLIVPHDAGH